MQKDAHIVYMHDIFYLFQNYSIKGQNNEITATRIIFTSEKSEGINQRGSRISATIGHNRLGCTNRINNEYSLFENKGSYRSGAALSGTSWSGCTHGSKKHHLSGSRGFNQTLCSGQISVQSYGYGLGNGPHNHIRLHANPWRGGDGRTQPLYFKNGSRKRTGRTFGINERYNGTRREDTLSQRNRVDVKVCTGSNQKRKKSWRQIQQTEEKAERRKEKSKRPGANFSPVCQNQGTKTAGRQEAGFGSRRYSQTAKENIIFGSKPKKQTGKRAETVEQTNGHPIATDISFYRNRFCRPQKNHSSPDGTVVCNSSWQIREACRIWHQVGNQSNTWRIHFRFYRKWRAACFGQEILYRGYPGAQKSLRPSSEYFWLRPRWLQQGQCQESEKAWSSPCWNRPQGKKPVVSIKNNAQKSNPPSLPGRGCYWNNKISALWLQQAQRQDISNHENLWAPRNLWVQSQEAIKRGNEISSQWDMINYQIDNKTKSTNQLRNKNKK